MTELETILEIKLRTSIRKFGYGTLILRNNNELIDGRKRLKILEFLNINRVKCILYPELSDSDTLVLLRNLHYEWSQINVLIFAELLNLQFSEKDVDELANVIPENIEEVEGIFRLLDFDWNKFNNNEKGFF
ncbi:MAG: hypothetical protein KKC03_13780 [Bacteroidetes bacterium]|nr:hypothetical protein [Bacteroidota bacterium]